MQEIDDELIARALRWCADAGRQASAEQVRAALGPLSWDELLATRAFLADPPPSRPLGPWALADLARGALPDVAAQREREGQYRREPGEGMGPPPRAPDTDAVAVQEPTRAGARRSDATETGSRRASRAGAARPAAGPVIRRARDRVEPAPAVRPALPFIDGLIESEGRAVLEGLLRTHGARRARIVAALAARWRRRDAAAVDEADLALLLETHGLTRTFHRRERDELLHALRAAGGVSARAAELAGMAVGLFAESLARLGADADAEAIRSVHRDEIRRRGTLSERVRLVLEDPQRLGDLGILAEIEADLRRRLPEHVRALRAAGARSIPTALARSLSVSPGEVAALLTRLGVAVDVEPRRAEPRPPPAPGERRPGSHRASPRGAGAPRPRRPVDMGTQSVPPQRPPGARPAGSRGPGSRGAPGPASRGGSPASAPRRRSSSAPARGGSKPGPRDRPSGSRRGPGRRQPR